MVVVDKQMHSCVFGGNARKLCDHPECHVCYHRSFASSDYAYMWSAENDIQPRQIFMNSRHQYQFQCADCSHQFDATPYGISNGKSCPYCAGKRLCSVHNCILCLQHSFASYKESQLWSPRNLLSPRQILATSMRKYVFVCRHCAHSFAESPRRIIQGHGCPYCADKELCGDPTCRICHLKSFANHCAARYWSEENEISPWQVFVNSHTEYIFDCANCEHWFKMTTKAVIDGHWCPFCKGKMLCNDQDCQICMQKSFAGHWKSEFWSPENEVSPRQIFATSTQKYSFKCECGHSFQATPNDVISGKWCPQCREIVHNIVQKHLEAHFGSLYRHLFRPHWCRDPTTSHIIPFDFAIPKSRIAIEIDNVDYLDHDHNSQSKLHVQNKLKMCQAWQNDYSIIRITDKDIINDCIDFNFIFTQCPRPILSCRYPMYEKFCARYQLST